MKIIIDIPIDVYEEIMVHNRELRESGKSAYYLEGLIQNGTPLPKEHGRLIDSDYLKDVILLHSFHGNNKNIVPYSDRRGYRLRQREVDEGIINAPTIIEADKGE
jgi:hypothetical protein